MTDLLELRLESPAYNGNAVARHQGRAIFVPYGVPGDHVHAQITRDKGRFAFADIIDVITPSPLRIVPECPHFGPGRCGGCHYQQVNYAAQCQHKQQIVADQMARIGGLRDVTVHPTLPSPHSWHYRAHATFHVEANGRLGYVMTDDQTVLAVDVCHIIQPALSSLLEHLRTHDFRAAATVRLQVGSSGEETLIALTPASGAHIDTALPPLPQLASVALLLPGGRTQVIRGSGTVHYHILGHDLRVSAGSFFQVNLGQAAALVRLVRDFLDLQGHERVLDLFAGVGLFSVFLAGQAREVVLIESAPSATEDARHNLAAYPHVQVIQEMVERALNKQRGSFDAAVVDPPRAGLKPEALHILARIAPRRIAYVSCDPTTLARDAKMLVAAGYTLVDVQPIDMFPQTYHIEAVARFVRA